MSERSSFVLHVLLLEFVCDGLSSTCVVVVLSDSRGVSE